MTDNNRDELVPAEIIGGAIYEEMSHITGDDDRSGTLTMHAERFKRLGAAALRKALAYINHAPAWCPSVAEADRGNTICRRSPIAGADIAGGRNGSGP